MNGANDQFASLLASMNKSFLPPNIVKEFVGKSRLIANGTLTAHKITWQTMRGRAFAILCKDGPLVLEIFSLLTNQDQYDSQQIAVAEQIAMSFRKH